jgi:hypothetical protein
MVIASGFTRWFARPSKCAAPVQQPQVVASARGAAAVAAAQRDWQRTARAHTSQPGTYRCRFNPTTIGFWLGGLVLGIAGCIYAASLSYRHLVGAVVGLLWWAVYCGCLGPASARC